MVCNSDGRPPPCPSCPAAGSFLDAIFNRRTGNQDIALTSIVDDARGSEAFLPWTTEQRPTLIQQDRRATRAAINAQALASAFARSILLCRLWGGTNAQYGLTRSCTVAATSRSSKLEVLALGTLKTDARPRAVSFRAIKDSTGPGLCTVQAWPAALAPTKVWRARSRWQSWLARTPSTKHLGTPHVSNTCGACRPSGTHYVDGAPCPRVCLQRTMLTLQTARGNCLKMRPRHPRALSY